MMSVVDRPWSRHAHRAALGALLSVGTATAAAALPRTAPATAAGVTAPGWWRQQTDTALTWSGTIPAGRRLFLKNVTGAIDVRRSTTGQVQVRAVRTWRRGDPAMVRVTRQDAGSGDVLICALWGPEATCDLNGMHNSKAWKLGFGNNVSVQLIAEVPDNVQVDAETVNGGLTIVDIGGAIQAKTVNGSITAHSNGGPVGARTVNGSIRAAMNTPGQATDIALETVNGSITLELPATFGADIDLRTVNGRITTAIPVAMTGSPASRRIQGTIGASTGAPSGVHLSAKAVNGSISLRKR